MSDKYAWKNFGYSLESTERTLKDFEYRGIFETPSHSYGLDNFGLRRFPPNALALVQVDSILSEAALAPAHGLDVLVPPPAPQLPDLPAMPDKALMQSYQAWLVERYDKLKAKLDATRKLIEDKMRREQAQAIELAARCKAGDPIAIRHLMQTILVRHPLPQPLALDTDFALDRLSRVALCTIRVPDLAKLPIVNKRGHSWKAQWLPVSEPQRKRSSESVLQALCIRAAYLVAMGDPSNFFDTVAVNAHQKWFDPATGAPREGIVASLQATKEELCKLQPGHLDTKACFRHLCGISMPDILNAAPICHRPAYWSHFVIGIKGPADDRHIGASAGSA